MLGCKTNYEVLNGSPELNEQTRKQFFGNEHSLPQLQLPETNRMSVAEEQRFALQNQLYLATVNTSDKRPPETYVGLTENKVNTRCANHKASLSNIQKQS